MAGQLCINTGTRQYSNNGKFEVLLQGNFGFFIISNGGYGSMLFAYVKSSSQVRILQIAGDIATGDTVSTEADKVFYTDTHSRGTSIVIRVFAYIV